MITGTVYLERGEPVRVLVAWHQPSLPPKGQRARRGPRNVLIERPDGTRVVRPFRGLRKVPSNA